MPYCICPSFFFLLQEYKRRLLILINRSPDHNTHSPTPINWLNISLTIFFFRAASYPNPPSLSCLKYSFVRPQNLPLFLCSPLPILLRKNKAFGGLFLRNKRPAASNISLITSKSEFSSQSWDRSFDIAGCLDSSGRGGSVSPGGIYPINSARNFRRFNKLWICSFAFTRWSRGWLIHNIFNKGAFETYEFLDLTVGTASSL
jgi:hypothetical protein